MAVRLVRQREAPLTGAAWRGGGCHTAVCLAERLPGRARPLEPAPCAPQGIPVERYTISELSVLYLGICGYIGNNVLQSSAGLRSKSRGFGMPVGLVKAR